MSNQRQQRTQVPVDVKDVIDEDDDEEDEAGVSCKLGHGDVEATTPALAKSSGLARHTWVHPRDLTSANKGNLRLKDAFLSVTGRIAPTDSLECTWQTHRPCPRQVQRA